jgi:hypothetical protein
VAGPASAGGEDAGGREHAVHVVGLGLRSDEHHVTAVLGPLDGEVRIERDLADGGARRHVQTGGDPIGRGLGLDGELRMQEGLDVVR